MAEVTFGVSLVERGRWTKRQYGQSLLTGCKNFTGRTCSNRIEPDSSGISKINRPFSTTFRFAHDGSSTRDKVLLIFNCTIYPELDPRPEGNSSSDFAKPSSPKRPGSTHVR